MSGIRRVATALQSKEYENHRRRMAKVCILLIQNIFHVVTSIWIINISLQDNLHILLYFRQGL